MAIQDEPAVGTVEDGYRYVGGSSGGRRNQENWQEVQSGPAAAGFTDIGSGWWRGPDGSVSQLNRQGQMIQRSGATPDAAAAAGASPDIREFQAAAAARATLMDEGLRGYSQAVDDGYNPSDWRNMVARFVEDAPIPGGNTMSDWIRDDPSERARAGELQFVDGALRTTSGAAIPEPEVVRGNRTYFRQPGEGNTVEEGRAALRDRFRNTSVRVAGDAYLPSDDVPLGPIDWNSRSFAGPSSGRRQFNLNVGGREIGVMADSPELATQLAVIWQNINPRGRPVSYFDIEGERIPGVNEAAARLFVAQRQGVRDPGISARSTADPASRGAPVGTGPRSRSRGDDPLGILD